MRKESKRKQGEVKNMKLRMVTTGIKRMKGREKEN